MLTIASQLSLGRLYHLPDFLEKWHGSTISVSIFVPGFDYHIVKLFLETLISCKPHVVDYLSVHLVYPIDKPPSSQKVLPIIDGCDFKVIKLRIEKIIHLLRRKQVRLL